MVDISHASDGPGGFEHVNNVTRIAYYGAHGHFLRLLRLVTTAGPAPKIFFGRLIAFFLALIRKPMKMRRFNARVFLTGTAFHLFDKNWTKYKRPCIAKKKGTYKILVLFLITIDSELRMPSKGKNKKANSGASSAKKKKSQRASVSLAKKISLIDMGCMGCYQLKCNISKCFWNPYILKFDLKKCTVQKKNVPCQPIFIIRRRLCRPMWVLVPGFRNMAPIGLVCFRLREWLVTPRGNDSDMKSNEIY